MKKDRIRFGFNYARGFSGDRMSPFDLAASHRRAEESVKKFEKAVGLTMQEAARNWGAGVETIRKHICASPTFWTEPYLMRGDREIDMIRKKLMKKDSWWNKNTPIKIKNWVWAIILGVFAVSLIFTLVKILG